MKVVKISKLLIKMLKPFGARYIKVAKPQLGNPKTGKGAIEKAWQERPYEADDPELEEWLAQGGNYGVICGQGIIEIDADDPKIQELIEENFETLTIQSGSGKGRHYYFRSNVTDNATILDTKINEKGQRENLANIQAKNKYVVGPGCNHYTGGTYKIIKDVPMVWITKEDIERIFGDYLVWSKQQRNFDEEQARKEMEQVGFDIPMPEIVDMSKLKQISADEWQGAHPVHGSTTGINFCVNVKKNCWHCFRHSSGGGALSWLAVREGLIKCEDARKGALRGELFRKVLDIARDAGFDTSSIEPDHSIEVDIEIFSFEKVGVYNDRGNS